LTQLENRSVNGNGRFATNLMNEAIQAQALRLMSHVSTLSMLDQASMIEKEDIEMAFHKLGKEDDKSEF
jgi:hypothetical protein